MFTESLDIICIIYDERLVIIDELDLGSKNRDF